MASNMQNPLGPETYRPMTARGEATRRRILTAAEQEFGERGFHAASVSSITMRAKVGQGTFYIYFKAKEDCFIYLVQDVGRDLRRTISEAMSGAKDRIEAEYLGLESFLEYTVKHPGLYRIVQECQFVDEPIFRHYYQRLAEGYSKGLEGAADRGELSEGHADTRAWALMGIGHFLGMRYCLWDGTMPSQKAMEEIMQFITKGIGPTK